MNEPVRLAKRLAAQEGISRREAELLVEGGWVRVDGIVVEIPQERVTDGQQVTVDAGAVAEPVSPMTLLLHKPAGASMQECLALLDPDHRAAGTTPQLRSVKRHFTHQVPLLPLPAAASGLAVFSQDGRVIRKLQEDAALLEQEVIAEVSGTIAEGGLAKLNHGLSIDGHALPPTKVSWQNETRLRFALKGIGIGDIPRMCGQVGLAVVAMKRLRIGRVAMAGLQPGTWRYLMPSERF